MMNRVLVVMVLVIFVLAGCSLPIGGNQEPSTTAEVSVLPATATTTPVTLPTATETVPVTYVVITATSDLKPTATAVILPTVTPQPIPASPTPAPPTVSPIPTEPLPTEVIFLPTAIPEPNGQVCSVCGGLRLRAMAGTAGNVQTLLDANTDLYLIGRTADSAWLQIRTVAGENGWVAREYIQTSLDLTTMPITGTALNLPTNTPGPTAVPVAAAPAPVTADNQAVVTGITAHARQIYLAGRARGNLPNVVSKIGDSITFSPSYLRQLGWDYNLGEYSYLQPAVNFFSGPTGRGENSFAAASVSAVPGWTTVDVLSPGGAPSPPCEVNEVPLLCEYRTARPSVALIMLGTVDSEGNITLEEYRANLERIIQITIEQGIVPVLSTIPPMQVNETRDARVMQQNQIIIEVARAYDIPLWNYYASMVGLPSLGLSGDGGHPSESPDGKHAYFDAEHLQYGYTMRNLTALQVMYELWRQVLYDAGPNTSWDNPPASAPAAAPADLTAVPAAPASNPDPNTYDCPGTPPLRLTVGGQGRITPGLPNRVRSEPSLSASLVGQLDGDTVFSVQGGPQCVDGYNWWYINANGVTGWTASGTMSEYWVLPYP